MTETQYKISIKWSAIAISEVKHATVLGSSITACGKKIPQRRYHFSHFNYRKCKICLKVLQPFEVRDLS